MQHQIKEANQNCHNITAKLKVPIQKLQVKNCHTKSVLSKLANQNSHTKSDQIKVAKEQGPTKSAIEKCWTKSN